MKVVIIIEGGNMLKKFELAPKDECNYMEEDVLSTIISLFGFKLEECLITDESMVVDFSPFLNGFSNEELAEFSKKLGVTVRNEDRVVDVARKMRGLI